MNEIARISPLDGIAIGKLVTPPEMPGQLSFEMVPVDKLYIDRNYQRTISNKSAAIIRKIVKGFSWTRFGALSVAKRDNSYLIIDGQHRAIAAMTLGVTLVPCMVSSEDQKGQALEFVGINNDRTRVGSVDKFRARCASGDKQALELAQMLTDLGITTDVIPGTPLKPKQTRAIAALERLMKHPGPGMLFTTLEVMLDAQPKQTNLLTSFAISATAMLTAKVIEAGGDLDDLVVMLRETDFESIRIDAVKVTRMFGGKTSHHGAKILVRMWNKGRTKGRIKE